MSEEIKTDEAKAAERKAREEKINARIAELKTYEGKYFMRKDGVGLPIKVEKYAGIFIKDGVATYTFTVETTGHARWNPSATDFLAEHDEIKAPAATATNDEPR